MRARGRAGRVFGMLQQQYWVCKHLVRQARESTARALSVAVAVKHVNGTRGYKLQRNVT